MTLLNVADFMKRHSKIITATEPDSIFNNTKVVRLFFIIDYNQHVTVSHINWKSVSLKIF